MRKPKAKPAPPKLLDFEPRSCGLCKFGRFPPNQTDPVGTCTVHRHGAVSGSVRPFEIRTHFGTCCEKFVAAESLTLAKKSRKA